MKVFILFKTIVLPCVLSQTTSPTISVAPTTFPTRPPSPAPSPFPTARPSGTPSTPPSNQPTSSIKPSPAPSARPSDEPTVSNDPTPSPTCNDSPFKVGKKDCSWVKQNAGVICSKKHVSSHCPLTCSTCEECIDSQMRFKLPGSVVASVTGPKGKKGSLKSKKCRDVAKKPEVYCVLPGVSDTCRVSCNQC